MPTTKEWTSIISTLYFYVMYAIGAVMTSVGVYGMIQWSINSVVFDDCPMGYDESRCSYILDSPKPIVEPRSLDAENGVEDEAQLQAQYDRCVVQLEKERSIRQITDFSRALGLLVVGIGLFSVHKFMKKDSK